MNATVGGHYYERMLECSVDDRALGELLEELAREAGATAAQLKTTNQRRELIQSTIVGDVDRDTLARERDFQGISPRTTALLAAAPGQVIRDADFISEAEIAKDKTYQRLLIPAKIGRIAGVSLLSSEEETFGVAVLRPFEHDPFDSTVVCLMNRVAADLMPAAELIAKLKNQKSNRLFDKLRDGLAAAILDANGNVLDRNEPFERLASEGRIAFRKPGQFRFSPQEEVRFEAALKRTLADGKLGRVTIRDQKRNSLLLASLYRTSSLGAFLSLGAAIVTIEELSARRAKIDPELLATTYGLTKAESQVAGMLFGGASIDDIAVARSVTINTVRSMTKSIMRKTDTSRQPELVSLLATLAVDEETWMAGAL